MLKAVVKTVKWTEKCLCCIVYFLPGTLSTRSALKTLLHGEVYHGLVILAERTDHHHLWRQAVNKTISREGWQTILSDYVAGVDNPIAHFYKEIIEVYPDVKVLLNVRDPDKWYQSVRDSILKVSLDLTSWPCSWFAFLMGDDVQIVWDLSEAVPSSSSSGLGLFSAVMAGRDTALEYYNDHLEEVKNHVPEDQLLVFNVTDCQTLISNFHETIVKFSGKTRLGATM